MPRFAKANKHVLFLEHNLTNHKTRKNNILTLIEINKKYTSDRTRTRNLRFRRVTPYPLGHGSLLCLEIGKLICFSFCLLTLIIR